jgi:hypothetical protein
LSLTISAVKEVLRVLIKAYTRLEFRFHVSSTGFLFKNIPVTAAVLRDTIKITLCITGLKVCSQVKNS